MLVPTPRESPYSTVKATIGLFSVGVQDYGRYPIDFLNDHDIQIYRAYLCPFRGRF